MFGDIRGSREAGRSSAWSTSGSRGRGRALRDHAAQGWCSLQEIGGRYDQGSVYVSRISGTLRKVVYQSNSTPKPQSRHSAGGSIEKIVRKSDRLAWSRGLL